MKWHTSKTMWAALFAMTILRSAADLRMEHLLRFDLDGKSSPIPHAVGSMTALTRLDITENRICGPIPDAIGSLIRLDVFFAKRNSLRGPIPHAVGSLAQLLQFGVIGNSLRGPIPHDVGSMCGLLQFSVAANSLSGAIPHAVGSMTALAETQLGYDSLSGAIPRAIGSMTHLRFLELGANRLSGAIPHAVGSMTAMQKLFWGTNRLSGAIPHAVGSITDLRTLELGTNRLSGSIPSGICVKIFMASDNDLSGAIPDGLIRREQYAALLVHRNRLTGTLPASKMLSVLTASDNLLEGDLPNTFSSTLGMLDVSGVPGRSGSLIGQLPPALCRTSVLKILTIANQQIHGGTPTFTSTLSILSLYNNRLKVLSTFDMEDSASKTTILLHNNLLSCYLPMFGDATAKLSMIAIGNQLPYPKHKFPAWVLEYERDPLLWKSGTEGMSLVLKISGAVGLFVFVVASTLGSAKVLSAMSEWQIGPQAHIWVVKASSYLHTYLATGSLVAAVVIVLLLSETWDLYVCPQTLATLSACSRSSALIRVLVFLWWCRLSFHSPAVDHLRIVGENQKEKWTAKMLRHRLLLWVLWYVPVILLSTLAILYQVAKSVPSFLQTGEILAFVLSIGVGASQGLVSSFIVPQLASSMMLKKKHVFITVASLLTSCVIPAVIILYLDTGCFGRWVSLWKPCRSNRQLFQRRLTCTLDEPRDCDAVGQEIRTGVMKGELHLQITALRPSESPMRSTRLVDFLFHVKVHQHFAAAVARDVAGKVSHNGAGDIRYDSREGQLAHRLWNHRGQHWNLHGLCVDEHRSSPIDEFHSLSCLLV